MGRSSGTAIWGVKTGGELAAPKTPKQPTLSDEEPPWCASSESIEVRISSISLHCRIDFIGSARHVSRLQRDREMMQRTDGYLTSLRLGPRQLGQWISIAANGPHLRLHPVKTNAVPLAFEVLLAALATSRPLLVALDLAATAGPAPGKRLAVFPGLVAGARMGRHGAGGRRRVRMAQGKAKQGERGEAEQRGEIWWRDLVEKKRNLVSLSASASGRAVIRGKFLAKGTTASMICTNSR